VRPAPIRPPVPESFESIEEFRRVRGIPAPVLDDRENPLWPLEGELPVAKPAPRVSLRDRALAHGRVQDVADRSGIEVGKDLLGTLEGE
jgi:hypothetical protein